MFNLPHVFFPARGSFVPDRPREDQIKYFRGLIDDTTLCMSAMADKWERVLNNPARVAQINEEGKVTLCS